MALSEQIGVPLNLVSRMERLPLTSYQHRIFIIIALAWLFDSMDLAMMTFLLAPIAADFSLDAAASGLLGSSSLAGMAFGAALAGMLADRFGRKIVFQVSMIVWGAAGGGLVDGNTRCHVLASPVVAAIIRRDYRVSDL